MTQGATAVEEYARALPADSERVRFWTAVETLRAYRPFYAGQRVLDYGCSWGTSAVALIMNGGAHVVGIEPELRRVTAGHAMLSIAGLDDRIELHHTPVTHALDFPDGAFGFVLANAVLEHIPTSTRQAHIRELWRLTAQGGYLLINETPNVYYPKDVHTTQGLWFNQFLPEDMAYRRAVRHKRFGQQGETRENWKESGWRGLGWYELVRSIRGWTLIPETSRLRHRVFTMLGLPASLFDPYPTWLLRKDPE